MARAKKDTEKQPAAASTMTLDVESFLRTRDSMVTSLATLQDAVQTLSTAYIKQTNMLLGEHSSSFQVESVLSGLANNSLMGGGAGLANLRAASPPKSPVVESKKEKKKRVHDPNAPKRPLTPYFLYMQTARPIIAGDLGAEVPKGAVSTEGVRRWNIMNEQDKKLWNNAYHDNLRLYNARVHSYKAGNLSAKDMTDEDALNYAEHHNIGMYPEPTADGQLTAEAMVDAPGEVDDEVQEVPAAKGKAKAAGGAARSRKSGGPKDTIVPPAPIVPQVTEKEKSPDKKRKRPGKKDAAEPETEKEAAAPAGKKSRKSKG